MCTQDLTLLNLDAIVTPMIEVAGTVEFVESFLAIEGVGNIFTRSNNLYIGSRHP